jgi:hypothetical protein
MFRVDRITCHPRPRSRALLTSLAAALLICLSLAGCGDDDSDSKLKGAACTDHSECSEANARCRGGICTGALNGDAFEIECDTGQADICAGLACLGFKANKQNKTGICTMPCTATSECGPGAACSDIGASQKLCVSVCTENSDCQNGFVCVADPNGAGKACLVEAS